MSNRWGRAVAVWVGLGLVAGGETTWKPALPGYQFAFPRDHFSHAEFQTEWWYYTGNLRAANGHRFGYELTFFRQAAQEGLVVESAPAWRPDEIYLAHLALSDIDGHTFFHTPRLNRAGPGLAGAGQHDSRYWNGNWQVRWLHPGVNAEMQLEAVADGLSLELALRPEKPVVVEGRDGVSRKGPGTGEASHYLSFTRIDSEGRLLWKGRSYAVRGISWMDHEFFSEPADNNLIGWDWFSIQLENREEVMLYRLRRSGGGVNYSSGTYVDARGDGQFLEAGQFAMTPGGEWQSETTKAKYPLAWRIAIPAMGLELQETTDLQNQELNGGDAVSPSYWEGAVNYRGTLRGKAVKGVGYLEMTGYGKRMRLGGT